LNRVSPKEGPLSLTHAITAALTGIHSAHDRTAAAADRISRFGQPGAPDRLPEDIVEIKLAKAAASMNAKVVQTAAEMEKETIDLLA